jgi:acetyl esterase/lipase
LTTDLLTLPGEITPQQTLTLRLVTQLRLAALKSFRDMVIGAALLAAFALCAQPLWAQQQKDWAETASFDYGVAADITYGTFNNTPVQLDVWSRNGATEPAPTLMYIHGGGWVFGSKDGAANLFLPYIERGWTVVNVEYRMAGNSLAPGAVEDARCALRWMYRNAAKYHIDTQRIVATGHSAGGHLALMVGMLPNNSDLDRGCPADATEPPLKVAAIVNWYGISDVADLLQGPDLKTYALAWIGAQPQAAEVAHAVSPMTYVRPGLPPIITVHGDKDPTVPYTQSVQLHKALTAAGDTNKLITIPGGVHGSFNPEQTADAFQEIWKFLEAQPLNVRKRTE